MTRLKAIVAKLRGDVACLRPSKRVANSEIFRVLLLGRNEDEDVATIIRAACQIRGVRELTPEQVKAILDDRVSFLAEVRDATFRRRSP